MRRLARALVIAAAAVLAVGCATLPPDAGNNPVDPWEPFNRNVWEVNEALDRALIKPFAQGYEFVVPQPLRTCIGNVLDTIRTVPTALNFLLQGNGDDFGAGMSRVLVNMTLGIAGCFDPASDFDIPKLYSDFGVTLGKWGAPSGPYFVLPLLGPSTVRDALGRLPDEYLNPQIQLRQVTEYPVFFALNVADTRARLFPLEKQLDDSGLDRYTAIRDAYLQRRRQLVSGASAEPLPLPVYDDPGAEPAPPAKP
jgi:phospholipid-binding lipoprotein MlaA